MDEFASIRHWTAERQTEEWQRRRGVVLGIGDDAAVIDPLVSIDGLDGPYELVMAMDTMVETLHFNERTMADEDIGYKALAANISDIAAMGGIPLHALVSASVPRSFSPERMRQVYDGLYACAERYGVAVIGGDTTSSPQHLVVAVTVTGAVEAGRALRRSGAQPGDVVVLAGQPLGMSAGGLHLLDAPDSPVSAAFSVEQPREAAALARAHQRPEPSVRAGRLLLAHGCRSLNDVSDGLASEAWEIAEASGVRLIMRERDLPRSGSMTAFAAASGVKPLEWMLYGGEDYALLGTMKPSDAAAAKAAFQAEGLPFYIIGEVQAGSPEARLIGADDADSAPEGVLLAKKGYNHFDES
ncbi:thiamine-phosphate kinase [Paenibacillus sp. NPDC058071]|uniref:thiamine-phosphate kinase n=1 Tax=Paenibacillus sp. NPDC058071 TaxID=3346326 RepID=UPI0036DBECEF